MEEEIPFESVEQARKYGYFLCMYCLQEWESASCWPGKWQKCRLCKRENYPYKMLPVSQVRRSSVVIAPHPQDLCQKCIETGTCCESI